MRQSDLANIPLRNRHGATQTVPCAQCGTPVVRSASHWNGRTRVFCSVACKRAAPSWQHLPRPAAVLALLLLAVVPASAKLTRTERQAIRACRQACRAAVLHPTTTTSSTTTTTDCGARVAVVCPACSCDPCCPTYSYPTTTSTTTTTTTLPSLDTPCGLLQLRGLEGPPTFGEWFDGTLACTAGVDTFQGYWPLAAPPTITPLRGGCTGTTNTFTAPPWFQVTLTCPVCCPQGMTVTIP